MLIFRRSIDKSDQCQSQTEAGVRLEWLPTDIPARDRQIKSAPEVKLMLGCFEVMLAAS
jgi:hypothetical protein